MPACPGIPSGLAFGEDTMTRQISLQTFFPTLFGRTRAHDAPRGTSHPALLRYRLIVLALTSQTPQIDTLVRSSLQYDRLSTEAPITTARVGGYLTESAYTLQCRQDQRAALVRLVTHLGETPGVRAIRWETVPKA